MLSLALLTDWAFLSTWGHFQASERPQTARSSHRRGAKRAAVQEESSRTKLPWVMLSCPQAVSTQDREILLLQHLDGRWIDEALTHDLEHFCHSTSLVLSTFTCTFPGMRHLGEGLCPSWASCSRPCLRSTSWKQTLQLPVPELRLLQSASGGRSWCHQFDYFLASAEHIKPALPPPSTGTCVLRFWPWVPWIPSRQTHLEFCFPDCSTSPLRYCLEKLHDIKMCII